MRKAFEKWATHNGFAVHRNGGDQYVNTPTHHAWNGWKGASEAGAAAPAEGAATQEDEQFAATVKLAERMGVLRKSRAAAPKEKP